MNYKYSKVLRRCLVLPFIVGILCMLMAGCGTKEGQPSSSTEPLDLPSVNGSADTLDDVADLSDIPVYGADEGEDIADVQPLDAEDKMYTVEPDGYAYVLDTLTMEPTGEPLDPITYEPINATATSAAPGSAETTATDNTAETMPPLEEDLPAQPEQEVPSEKDNEAANTYTAEQPTSETKYPNTGIFLEDD